jgi:hypothetical protein
VCLRHLGFCRDGGGLDVRSHVSPSGLGSFKKWKGVNIRGFFERMSIVRRIHPVAFILFLFAVAWAVQPASGAGLVIYGTHTDHPVVPGGDITDVRMTVELSVAAGVATFTFSNTSVLPETSAVIDEIVLDLYDDDLDTGGDVLWDPVILTNTEKVRFSMGASNGLPGYGPMTTEVPPLLELGADPPPSKRGLDIGESLVVQFETVLPDGSDRIADYLAWFDGGSDTANYSIGFHALKASTLDDESLSGIYEVPEPGTLLLVGFGALLVLIRRVRR